MITVKGLTKRYGSKTVVNDVSFTIEKGEVVGFFAPNGAVLLIGHYKNV